MAATSVRQFVRATDYPLLGKVWLSSVCWCTSAKPGNEAECRIYGGWVKMQVEFEAVCGPKFTKFSDDVENPLYFPTPVSHCLCRVSFRRYSPLSLKIVEKPSKCKSFWPPIFVWGTAPTFVRHFVRATYYQLLGKVWLSSVCLSPSAKPGNEAECRIYEGFGKNGGRIWSCLWTKVHDILGRCRRHLVVVNAFDRLSISSFLPKIYAVKVALKFLSGPIKVVFGPPICKGRNVPDFGHAFSNYTYFLSLIHIWRCRRSYACRSRWSPYH